MVIATPDARSDGGFDSRPEVRPRRSSHPITQLPIYKLHFGSNSQSGSGGGSGGGGRESSAATRGSSYTTSNSSASLCTSDNCSHRNPCQFHSTQRKLSAVSNQSAPSSSTAVVPDPVIPEPVIQPPVVPVVPAPVVRAPVVQSPVIQEPAAQPPVTPTPFVQPTYPRKDSRVSTSSLSRLNTGHSSSRSSRLRAKPTWKSIGICAFTGLGGLLFGYDTGYINGVMSMPYFENMYLG